jgi:amidase
MAGHIHHLAREQIVYTFDKSHPPALEIDSGDVVEIETHDARTGTIQRNEDSLEQPHPDGANPATGPIRIRGAEPGDGLCVEIMGIELAQQGFLGVKKGMGLLGHLATKVETRIVNVTNGQVDFDGIRFPANPMVGVISTAPAGEAIATGMPAGGNMDNRYVTTGSKVYLPVHVDGALFGLGDVHGAMGDGEITYIGLEICAEVTVRIHLLEGVGNHRPLIETPELWVTTGEHEDLGLAARMAAEEMVVLMQEKGGLSFEQAYMLMSAAVDVQICQCCEPGEFPTTTRAVLRKALLPSRTGA